MNINDLNQRPDSDIAVRSAARKFTEEEIEHLSKLPIRKVRFAGSVTSAWYDEKSFSLYILDENGVPTGEVRVMNKPLPSKPQPTTADVAKAAVQDAVSKGGKGKNNLFVKLQTKKTASAETTPKQESDEPNTATIQKKSLIKAMVFSAIITAVVILSIVFAISYTTKDHTTSAANQRVNAIQLTTDVIPGDLITESMLTKVSISNETYNQVSLTGNTIYTWDRMPFLIGMYATNYTAAGQFLTHNDITGIYDPGINPFIDLVLPEGYAYIDIPVNISFKYIDSICLGRYVDLKLEINTIVDKPEKIDTEDVEGLDHSSSITEHTVTDIYRLNDVAILDITASDGSSLYETLSSLNAIPDGELRNYLMDTFSSAMDRAIIDGAVDFELAFPEYYLTSIRIKLPAAQVKAIGKLTAENTTVTMSSISDTYVSDTEAQIQFTTDSEYTLKILSSVFDVLT